MSEVDRRDDYSRIEEIERDVRRLFSDNVVSMPIEMIPQSSNSIKIRINNIPSKRKILIKRKK